GLRNHPADGQGIEDLAHGLWMIVLQDVDDGVADAADRCLGAAKPFRTFMSLEPISKSFEEDDEAGKLDKAKEIVGVVLPANEDPALPLNPGEEALDEPASHVAA